MQRNIVAKLKGGENGKEMSNELFRKMVCVFKIPVEPNWVFWTIIYGIHLPFFAKIVMVPFLASLLLNKNISSQLNLILTLFVQI